MPGRDKTTTPAAHRATRRGAAKIGRPCPVCGEAAVAPHHPFCSARCQDVDLGRWLKGNYAIPGRPVGFESDDD